MFNAAIKRDTLAATLDSVGTLVDECKIHTGPDGIEICAVDPANVGMVDLELAAGEFESYEGAGGVIGTNIGKLEDFAAMADAGQTISLALDEETRKLEASVGGLEATFALIDPDSIRQEPDIPDLDLTTTVNVGWARVERAIKAADMVSDHVTIRTDADAENVVISAEGDTDDTREELTPEDMESYQIPREESAASKFSLDYLKDMKSAIPDDAVAELRFGQELPVKIGFEREGVDVLYMLAPRVDSS